MKSTSSKMDIVYVCGLKELFSYSKVKSSAFGLDWKDCQVPVNVPLDRLPVVYGLNFFNFIYKLYTNWKKVQYVQK